MSLIDDVRKLGEVHAAEKQSFLNLEFEKIKFQIESAARAGAHQCSAIVQSEIEEMLKKEGFEVKSSNAPGEEYHSIISW